MKAFLVPALAVLASASWADGLLTARQMIAQAYGKLALQNVVSVNLTGDVLVGGDRRPFAVQMVVQRVPVSNTDEKLYFEGLVSDRAATTQRIVGDGSHLWIYDAKRNTYSVVDYGSAEGLSLRGSRLFNTLKRVTSGPAQFVAGFLADVDRSRTAGAKAVADSWTPYLGTATITVSGLGIACQTRPPVDTNLTYGFGRDVNGVLYFTSATYESSRVVAGLGQKTSWSMLASDLPSERPDFTFDKGNATPVSITIAQGGG